MNLDDNLPLAARRPRRQDRRLPQRYRDILPEPLPATHLPSNPSPSPTSSPTSIRSFTTRIVQFFRTPRNVFGLFRQYCSDRSPSHDPEENIDLFDLSNFSTGASQPHNNESDFFPFPNKNSFLLGEWYWTDGVQKSQESFNTLLSIVGRPDFRPEDVRHTKWGNVDAVLAKNDFDENRKRHRTVDGSGIRNEDDTVDDDGDAEWADEDVGWKKTPISISVPFHHRMKNPGTKEYYVGDLYHRPLVSVIRERLANPDGDQNFHYEPFELFWKPTDDSVNIRVHGELYTSPAFLEAHRALQDSPREPGCDLPRVVAAMMFWSDGTHLTSFGNAKLHPCYLYFGNNSKYRRCRPTCHLSNHVAYFQTVGLHLYLGYTMATFNLHYSSRMHLKTSSLSTRAEKRLPGLSSLTVVVK